MKRSPDITVLMSIRTKYASKIFAGTKKWEFRKAVPTQLVNSLFPARIVVYSSEEERAIVGDFRVGRVVRTTLQKLMAITGHADDPAAVEWFREYYRGRTTCCAIEVLEPRRYDTPFDLPSLREALGGFVPPQSFAYVGEKDRLRSLLPH